MFFTYSQSQPYSSQNSYQSSSQSLQDYLISGYLNNDREDVLAQHQQMIMMVTNDSGPNCHYQCCAITWTADFIKGLNFFNYKYKLKPSTVIIDGCSMCVKKCDEVIFGVYQKIEQCSAASKIPIFRPINEFLFSDPLPMFFISLLVRTSPISVINFIIEGMSLSKTQNKATKICDEFLELNNHKLEQTVILAATHCNELEPESVTYTCNELTATIESTNFYDDGYFKQTIKVSTKGCVFKEINRVLTASGYYCYNKGNQRVKDRLAEYAFYFNNEITGNEIESVVNLS
jgi:hypothetical protein